MHYSQRLMAFEVMAQDTIVVFGNPVRKSVLSADRSRLEAELSIADNQTLLLIFGGSERSCINSLPRLSGASCPSNLRIIQSNRPEALTRLSRL